MDLLRVGDLSEWDSRGTAGNTERDIGMDVDVDRAH